LAQACLLPTTRFPFLLSARDVPDVAG